MTTTAVTIQRHANGVDPYEAATWSTVSSGVPAVVSGSSGFGSDIGGQQQVLTAKLFVNEGVDVQKSDRITDETSGEVWIVDWVRVRYELALGHVVAGLTAVEGATN